ncbi:MAG: aldehyde dehydrogenase family protein, partial [Gammaproteobacteria bacterium]
MVEIKNFINGEWVSGHKTVDNINPANTNDVINQAAEGNAADVDSAVQAASNAFPAWRDTTPQARHDLLDAIGNAILDRKEEFGTVLAREEGKTLPEAIGETIRAGQVFKFFAGEALRCTGDIVSSVRPDVDIDVTREPLGVVGIITPWNFPIAIPAWKMAPALAFGNCVV